jgi:hypothetical protein
MGSPPCRHFKDQFAGVLCCLRLANPFKTPSQARTPRHVLELLEHLAPPAVYVVMVISAADRLTAAVDLLLAHTPSADTLPLLKGASLRSGTAGTALPANVRRREMGWSSSAPACACSG